MSLAGSAVRAVGIGIGIGLALAGCDPEVPVRSCTDDLRGVYVVDGKRWMVLDHRATLEAYPLFDDVEDVADAPALEIAPRVIDLRRVADALAGDVRRRYLRGTDRCEARVPVHVTSCTGAGLEVVLADPVPPIGFAPCEWPRPAPSRRERWRRE